MEPLKSLSTSWTVRAMTLGSWAFCITALGFEPAARSQLFGVTGYPCSQSTRSPPTPGTFTGALPAVCQIVAYCPVNTPSLTIRADVSSMLSCPQDAVVNTATDSYLDAPVNAVQATGSSLDVSNGLFRGNLVAQVACSGVYRKANTDSLYRGVCGQPPPTIASGGDDGGGDNGGNGPGVSCYFGFTDTWGPSCNL